MESVRSKSKTCSKKQWRILEDEENRKQIKLLTAEKQKLNQKLQIFLEENKALKDLAKMPLDDEMARNVVRRELARERSVCDNRREHVEAKRNHKTKRYREDTESEESEEEEREYKRPKSKKRKNLDKKKAKARVKVKARARKRSSKRRKKKLIKCRTTYTKNQNNLNFYRVNRT